MAQASIDLKQKIINIQQYTNSTDRVDFVFERYTKTGIDLAQLQAWILLDTVDIIVSNITENFIQTYSETKVKLEWLIDGGMTQEKRDIPFQIVFTDGEDVKVYTTVGKLKINESIGVEDVIIPSNLSLFQQWLKKMETLAALVENGGGAGGSGGGSGSGSGGSGSEGSTENLYISKVETLYAKSTSKEIVPESGWYKYKPDWEEGYYIWQKICIHYKDGTSFESVPTCIIGSENEYILSKIDALENITQEDINRLNKLLDELEEDTITIGTLKAHLAKIDVAQIGDLFAETLQAFTATVASSTINDAYIKNLVSENITVADLKAKDTLTERVVLLGDDSSPTIAFEDGTQQFYDSNGKVRVQIGQDGNGDFNFIVRGQDGTTALFDENGVTTDAIADGLIKENMIGDGEVSKEKINFPIIEPNEFGGVDITQVYDGNEKFGIEYTEFKENINSRFTETDEKITTINESTNNISSVVDEVNKSISNKIWQTDISNSIKEYSDGQTEIINEIRDRIISQEENLEGFQTTVSETYSTKTELADVTDDVSDLQKWSTETWKTEAKQLIGKDYITSTVGEYYTKTSDFEDTVDEVRTTANQTAEKFNWLVKSGTSETDFTLTDRTATLIADNINLNGLVTFSGLNSEVKNKIDNGISKVDVMYANHTSSTTAPTTGWSTTAPAWENGKYMWQKTVTTYISGQVSETSPTVLTGATGSPGLDGKDGTSITILGSYSSESDLNVSHPTGNLGDGYIVNGDLYVWNGDFWENVGRIQGDKGDDGVGVSKIIEQYYLSSSNTNQSDGNWSESSPSWVSGKYIWTRSKLEYDNGNISYTTPVLANALNSANSTAKNADDNATYSLNTVKAWGYGNNVTYIDGGKIYTGSITADKITTNDIIGTNGWINLAKGTFNYGNQLVWDGKKLQVSAEAVKISIKDVIDDIDSDISSVDSKATNAQNTADTASGKADVAQTTANNAQITANQAQSSIDNLEIGGRNLLRNTSDEWMSATWAGYSYNIISSAPIKNYGLNVGDSITFSLDIKSDSGYKFGARIILSDSNAMTNRLIDKYGSIRIQNGTGRSSVTVTIPENATHMWLYLGMHEAGSVTVNHTEQYKCLKLEKGTVATDWTPAPEDLEGEVQNLTTQYSEFNQELNEISATVGKHETDISETNSQLSDLTVDLSGFKTTVSETYTTKSAFDALDVGTRNLIKGTNQGTTNWYVGQQNGTTNRSSVTALGVNALKLTVETASTGYHVVYNNGDLMALIKKGGTYTVAFDVYPSSDLTVRASYQLPNGTNNCGYWSNKTCPANTWTHYESTITFNPNIDISSSQVIYLTGFNVVGEHIIANLMLVEGNKVGSWQPAPEDVEASITSAKETVIQQTNEAIALKASKTEVTDAVNNIQIGGRNLILDSKGDITFTDTHKVLPMSQYGVTSLAEGGIITFSFEVKANKNSKGDVYPRYGTQGSSTSFPSLIQLFDITTEWVKHSYTMELDSEHDWSEFTIRANTNIAGATSGVTSYWRNIKLEKGNKTTDWSPAPEDVDDSISALGTRVTSTEAALNVNSESITSVVKRTESLEKWSNDLEIGGRNLFRESGHWTTKPTWWVSNGGGLELDTAVQYMGYNTIKTTVGKGINYNGRKYFEVDTNKVYTYSAMIMSDSDFNGNSANPLHFHCSNSSDSAGSDAGITPIKYNQTLIANEWCLLYLTFKPKGKYFRPFVYVGSGSIICNIAYLKFEEGSIPTDWSPAPEDIVAEAEASFQVTADAIRGEVSDVEGRVSLVEQTSEALTVKIDNLEIGGRNLLRNSNFSNGTTYWVAAGVTMSVVVDDIYGKALKFSSTAAGSGSYRMYHNTSIFSHIADITYTLSFVAKASTTTQLQSNVAAGSNKNNYNLTTSWKRFTYTYTASATGSLTFWSVSANVDIYITNVKLEIGNKSTDWSPAPEDVIAEGGKTATNYLNFSDKGLIIGDHTAGTLGRNVLIGSEYIDFRNSDVTLARYGANTIELGKGYSSNKNISINLCDDELIFGYDSKYDTMSMKSKDSIYIMAPNNFLGVVHVNNSSYQATAGIDTSIVNAFNEVAVKTIISAYKEHYSNGNVTSFATSQISLYNSEITISSDNFNVNGYGDVLPGRDLIIKNGYSMFCKNTSGTQINALHMSSANQMQFGYGAYANGYLARYCGAAVEIGTPQGNFRPYFRPGDSITVRWRGAATVTGSGKTLVYCIPLTKPAVGCSGVTVATDGGFICRQNDKYCYGSGSETQSKDVSSHSAGLNGESHVRINTTMNNNTNVTNNDAIAIDASVKITFT